jgi:aldose 1-epimerase
MSKSSVSKSLFGTTPDGKEVYQFTLKNKNGLICKILNFGGIVTSLEVPDRSGKLADVVLGFDTLEPYFTNPSYFNAIIGRYGNRIAGGKFTLEGKEYTLAVNNGPNHLHGGIAGFDKQVWDFATELTKDSAKLILTYESKDGEEGYPGTLKCTVSYILGGNDELIIDYKATTDKTTIVNLTNHNYFNLAGAGNGNIFNHLVTINADTFTDVDDTNIPLGELVPVKGTPFDFATPHTIGSRIEKLANGYDHNFVLNKVAGTLSLAATVVEPLSGRKMEVHTTEPGVQFYTGYWIGEDLVYKGDKKYGKFAGFCLETQHFPDSPNKPQFPSTVLRPGEEYHTRTIHKFSTM